MRRLLYICVYVLILLMLSGCLFGNIDELYSLPQHSETYAQLQSLINREVAEGYEYSAPTSGYYRQSVQFFDANGSGIEEAFVFFRGPGQTLKICVYRKSDNDFVLAATVEGEGTSIGRVEYADLDYDGCSELIVAWQISPGLRTLSVYSMKDFSSNLLLSANCSDFYVAELSGKSDLIAIRRESPDASFVDMYQFFADLDPIVTTARMSAGIETVDKVRLSQLSDGTPAMFVDSSCADGKLLVTDIFIQNDDGITNITYNKDVGTSISAMRDRPSDNAYSQDIDGDRMTEVPELHRLKSENSPGYWVYDWYAFDSSGNKSLKLSTYHSGDGWYLILPESWRENLAARRDDKVSGERTVILSQIDPDSNELIDILAVYTLTGENRRDRARLSGRFIISEEETTIFSGRVLLEDWSNSLPADELVKRIKPIRQEWGF